MKLNVAKEERKWQAYWDKHMLNHADLEAVGPRYYCLDSIFLPTSSCFTLTQWRALVFSDVCCRFHRLQGKNILHPLGWDVFGPFIEAQAKRKRLYPEYYAQELLLKNRKQLGCLGGLYTWSQQADTSSLEYYRWTQLFFIKAYELGLIERCDCSSYWCESCLQELTREEVREGYCRTCGNVAEERQKYQWKLVATSYAQRLIDDLALVESSRKVKEQQLNAIGQRRGVEACFRIADLDEQLWIFTSRPDTLFGASYLLLAPEHSLVPRLCSQEQQGAVSAYVAQSLKRTREQRKAQQVRSGVFTGAYAYNPVNNEPLPIWLADCLCVDDDGGGMMVGVPAHDIGCWKFAQVFKLAFKQVVLSSAQVQEISNLHQGQLCPETIDQDYASLYPKLPLLKPLTKRGISVNSGEFSGLTSSELGKRLIARLESLGLGRACNKYRMGEWIIGQNDYWGAPVPMVCCESCGDVPVPSADLPVVLPQVVTIELRTTGRPSSAFSPEFIATTCPKCGGNATRYTETISGPFGASWYSLWCSCGEQRLKITGHEKETESGPEGPAIAISECSRRQIKHWGPVDLFVAPASATNRHLLYARFVTKLLYDLGVVDFVEPYRKVVETGKVSNQVFCNYCFPHWLHSATVSNTLNSVGSDVLRAFISFCAHPEKDMIWNDSDIIGIQRWFRKVRLLVEGVDFLSCRETNIELLAVKNRHVDRINGYIRSLSVNLIVAELMKWSNELRELKSKGAKLSLETMQTFVLMLSPIAPHFAEYLWEQLGNSESIFVCQPKWPMKKDEHLQPSADPTASGHNAAVMEEIALVIQINGRLKEVISVPQGMEQAEVEHVVMNHAFLRGWLKEQKIARLVYVPDRLLNLILEPSDKPQAADKPNAESGA